MSKAMEAKREVSRTRKHSARWAKDQLVCSCGSKRFTVFREPVARKVHTRTSRRRRRVGVCEHDHKTRIGFPAAPRQK
jgi:hypothetical protein